jgi:uncharacterized protein (DUF1330 family)
VKSARFCVAALEAGLAEILAWERAANVPSAGIALQQTDIPFCRHQLANARSCAPAPDKRFNDQWRKAMKTRFTVALSMLAGAAIGVVAVQGLQAQGKPKAYTVSELESLDPTAQATFTPLAQAAMKAAGGRTLNTGGGKVVGIDGPPPPKRVVINEWDSLDQAEAYYKSKAWNDLAPQRDKAIKTIRRYAVESAN